MKVKIIKFSGQRLALGAFWLRNINGTNSIGGSVVPRAGPGILKKRKICFLCWNLNTILHNPWSCAGSSQFHS